MQQVFVDSQANRGQATSNQRKRKIEEEDETSLEKGKSDKKQKEKAEKKSRITGRGIKAKEDSQEIRTEKTERTR